MSIIRDAGDVERGLVELIVIDPRLEVVAAVAGPLPLRLMEPGFAGLAHIIVSQMVSRASADAIWRRIIEATGRPTAQSYLALDEPTIATFGLSRAKAATLRLVAHQVVAGALDLEALVTLPGEVAFEKLTAHRGIGPWTAEVYLMFCGGHADIFPAGDVALRIAIGAAFDHPARPDIAAVREIAKNWSPWRSVAARLFWAYYARTSGREATPL